MSEKQSKKRRRSSVSKGSSSSSKKEKKNTTASSSASSSKRASNLGESVRISKVHAESAQIAVASFGAVEVPQDTEFQVFSRRLHGKDNKQLLVHGEQGGIEYEGQTEPAQSQYIVALYDADNGSVELYPGATYLDMAPVVTSKKNSGGPAIRSTKDSRALQRNKLGETFGTRKARKAITDQEVNRINTELLDDIQTELVDAVAATTANLPTAEELQASMTKARPIPPHNLEADKREDIYPLFGIVPQREWNMIRVDALFREPDMESRKALFPSGTSDYVSTRLAVLTDAAQHTERLRLLYYVAFLLTVFTSRKSVKNKAGLLKELNNPPELLVQGVLDRFVAARGGGEYGKSKERGFIIDSTNETKLLCYLLALMLKMDNYILEVLPLSTQLGLKPSRLSEVLKQLGCTIKPATALQADALGISRQKATAYKIASLKAPLKLPDSIKKFRRQN